MRSSCWARTGSSRRALAVATRTQRTKTRTRTLRRRERRRTDSSRTCSNTWKTAVCFRFISLSFVKVPQFKKFHSSESRWKLEILLPFLFRSVGLRKFFEPYFGILHSQYMYCNFEIMLLIGKPQNLFFKNFDLIIKKIKLISPGST